LVLCKFVDLDFLKKIKFSFAKKLKNLGYTGPFDVGDELYL